MSGRAGGKAASLGLALRRGLPPAGPSAPPGWAELIERLNRLERRQPSPPKGE